MVGMIDGPEAGTPLLSPEVRAALEAEKVVSELNILIEASIMFFEAGRHDESVGCMYMAGDKVKEYWA